MSDADLKKIFYKPTIEYDKSYYTESKRFDADNNNIVEEENPKEDIKESLKENISEIKDTFLFFPSSIVDLINQPLGIIDKLVDDFPDDIKTNTENGDTIIVNTVPTIDMKYPTFIFDDEDRTMDIEFEDKINHLDAIMDKYYYDLSSIIEDYLLKLRDTINKYLLIIIKTFGDNKIELFEKLSYYYTANTKDVSVNFKHISDTLIKLQIERDVKQRLYTKLYNNDKTITHIKMCKATVLQLIRYNSTNEIDENTFIDSISNKLLIENAKLYTDKYVKAFSNIYKYLNSSTVLLDDCINSVITEMQSKIILLEKEKEGNKLW